MNHFEPITATSDPGRELVRADYWLHKHANTHWGHDIHFACFSESAGATTDFQLGIRTNTEKVFHEVLEFASLFWLTEGPTFLDFGCGSGDLLLRLVEVSPKSRGVGIDIAPTAVAKAIKGSNELGVADQVEFITGGVSKFEEVQGQFDVILCRDAYYLLDESEQQRFLNHCNALLRPTGLLYIADLCVKVGRESCVQKDLLERQGGGFPIRRLGRFEFSMTTQARIAGFNPFGAPIVHEEAVSESYRLAAEADLPKAVRDTFERLAIAAKPSGGESAVPYVRFFFSKCDGPTAASDRSFGRELSRPIVYNSRQVLRAGEFSLPTHAWSLVIGRSGIGKSTLLRTLAGMLPDSSKHIGQEIVSSYLLPQRPELVYEMSVHANLKLFSKDGVRVKQICSWLGFDDSLLRRKADDRLSGGEQQRVALGQAILADPEVLLLDEPCSGLDKVRRRVFFQQLRAAKRQNGEDITVVCVDHDFTSIIKLFDYVFEIFDGRLVLVHRRAS